MHTSWYFLTLTLKSTLWDKNNDILTYNHMEKFVHKLKYELMCLIWPDIFTLLLLDLWQYWGHKSFGNIIVAIFSFGVEAYESVALDEKPHFTILLLYQFSNLNMLFIRAIGEIMKPL